MEHVGVYELKSNLSSMGRRAAAGEEVCVTRHGKPWFRLAPIEAQEPEQLTAAEREEKIQEILQRFHALPKVEGVTPEEIKEWINEGRDIA